MNGFPWLTVLGLIPLAGALVVALLPRGSAKLARPVALGFSVVTLIWGVIMATQFKTSGFHGQFQLAEVHNWIPQIGVSYALGVDGISLTLILMSIVLVPVCVLAGWNDVPDPGRRQQNYLAWMLALEFTIVAVFAATDVFLFYIFFEAMLVPVYFLIGIYGGPRRRYAATKFLLYSLAGSFVMLVAVIGLYQQGPGGAHGFLVTQLTGLHMSTATERWLFVGFFIAFAIKAPMVPVHTWLPDAASEARPATAVLLVGVLDKVGTFGMLRFCLQMFPNASHWATPVVLVLAVLSILYGALVAISQKDMMRVIAYGSISHFGFIVLGIFAMTTTSQAGADLYMINHGFTTAALFIFAGFLIARGHSRNYPDYGGWQRVTPVLAGFFLLACLSGLALPGLNSFPSEFLTVAGTFERYKVAGGFAVFCVILSALYMLLLFQRLYTGKKPTDKAHVLDLGVREKVVAGVLAVFIIGLGFYPKPALDMLRPAVTQTMQHVHAQNPAPEAGVTVDGSSK